MGKRNLRIITVAALACVAACGAETKEEGTHEATVVPEGGHAAEAPAAASDASAIPTPETVEIDGAGTCRKVGDDLLFCGQPTPDGLRALAAAGYRTVLNTRGEGELDWDEKALAEELGMTYEQIPMAYPIESISDEWVDRFDRIMKDDDRPLLAHCSSGNRVAGLWAVWLAERQGVAPGEALELGKKAGMTRIAPVVERRLAPSTAE